MKFCSIKVACLNCGLERFIQPNVLAAGAGKFCSMKCYSDYRQRDIFRFVDRGEPDDCWPWTGCKGRGGYGSIRWHGETTGAHRVIYEVVVGPIPIGVDILHSCDNPPCCNPKHLFPGTHLDNMRDAVAKGKFRRMRRAKGEECSNSKLTAENVTFIRTSAETPTILAAKFGVSAGTIADARSARTWKHVARAMGAKALAAA